MSGHLYRAGNETGGNGSLSRGQYGRLGGADYFSGWGSGAPCQDIPATSTPSQEYLSRQTLHSAVRCRGGGSNLFRLRSAAVQARHTHTGSFGEVSSGLIDIRLRGVSRPPLPPNEAGLGIYHILRRDECGGWPHDGDKNPLVFDIDIGLVQTGANISDVGQSICVFLPMCGERGISNQLGGVEKRWTRTPLYGRFGIHSLYESSRHYA